MWVFVKSRKTYETYLSAVTEQYSLCPHADDKDVSVLRLVNTNLGQSALGDLLIAGEYIGVISEISPDGQITNVTCNNILTILSRITAVYGTEKTYEGRLAEVINSEIVGSTDPEYAIPYMIVSEITETASNTENIGVPYDIYTCAEECRIAYGIYTTITAGKEGLHVTIERKEMPAQKVFFSDGRHQLISQDYGTQGVAKVTAYVVDSETNAALSSVNYYLMADGTVTTDPGENERARGKWTAITGTDAEKLAEDAAQLLTPEIENHQITFRSDQIYEYGATLHIRLPSGEVVQSRVTAITHDSTDHRTLYRAGLQKVTLTQKLRGVIK